jgi:hypothetical protein
VTGKNWCFFHFGGRGAVLPGCSICKCDQREAVLPQIYPTCAWRTPLSQLRGAGPFCVVHSISSLLAASTWGSSRVSVTCQPTHRSRGFDWLSARRYLRPSCKACYRCSRNNDIFLAHGRENSMAILTFSGSPLSAWRNLPRSVGFQLAAFRAAAQRFFCATEIRCRPAFDSFPRLRVLPAGRPPVPVFRAAMPASPRVSTIKTDQETLRALFGVQRLGGLDEFPNPFSDFFVRNSVLFPLCIEDENLVVVVVPKRISGCQSHLPPIISSFVPRLDGQLPLVVFWIF